MTSAVTMSDHAWADALFELLAQHSDGDVGVTRPSYSECESAALRMLENECSRAGLRTRYDEGDNLEVRLIGDDSPRAVYLGSHIDSVPQGGRYDGTAGVVAGLCVLRAMRREGTTLPVRVLALRGEESAWYGVPHIGAKLLFGALSKEAMQRSRPDKSTVLLDALHTVIGAKQFPSAYAAVDAAQPLVTDDRFAAWLELHIEQGPALVECNAPIAVVHAIDGSLRCRAEMLGEAGHSGATPMGSRKDALLAAVSAVYELAEIVRYLDEMRFTVGEFGTDPATHAVTKIPDRVTWAMEWRSGRIAALSSVESHARQILDGAAREYDTFATISDARLTPPCALTPAAVDVVRGACDSLYADGRLRFAAPRMASGAGHDASVFVQHGVPAGMIFVRNQHGSHNPHEAMDMDDFMLGVAALDRAARLWIERHGVGR